MPLPSSSELIAEARRLKVPVETNHVKEELDRRPWRNKKSMIKVKCPECGRSFERSKKSFPMRCPSCSTLIKKYALSDTSDVKSYFNEMKQHGVAFRTRMQMLSRIYGGRGGYSSEQLYKIVTGRATSAYYIYPFVKNAPPEVNRILESTYRRHRRQGDNKKAAGIAAWTKVKQAGYVKRMKPAPMWVKEKYMYNEQYQTLEGAVLRKLSGAASKHWPLLVALGAAPMLVREIQAILVDVEARRATENFQIAKVVKLRSVLKHTKARKLLHKKIHKVTPSWKRRMGKKVWDFPKKHPRATIGTGAFATGALLARPRRQRESYADLKWRPSTGSDFHKPLMWGQRPLQKHIDADVLNINRFTRPSLRRLLGKGVLGAKKGIKAAAGFTTKNAFTAASTALLGALVVTMLNEIQKRGRGRLPLPDIRPDIELAPRYSMDIIAQYAGFASPRWLRGAKTKLTTGAHKLRVGAEKNMLVWLLGFLTAELLGRGLSMPKRQLIHTGEVAVKKYARIGRLARKARTWWQGGMSARAARKEATALATGGAGKRFPKEFIDPKTGKAFLPPDWGGKYPHIEPIENRAIAAAHLRGLHLARAVRLSKVASGEVVGRASDVIPKLRKRRRVGVALSAAGATGLIPVKKKEKYVMGPAAKLIAPKVIRAVAPKAAKVVGKKALWAGIKKWGNRALWGSIAWDTARSLKPRRPLKPQLGPAKSGIQSAAHFAMDNKLRRSLGIEKKLRPIEIRPARPIRIHKERLPLAERREMMPKFAQGEPAEMYPFKSEAQRVWMHKNKPEMAEEWEAHTPKGKKLPERVSKHAWKGASVVNKLRGLLKAAVAAKTPRGGVFKLPPGSGLTDLLKLAKRERKLVALAGLGTGAVAAGVPMHVLGKSRERKRIRKMLGAEK